MTYRSRLKTLSLGVLVLAALLGAILATRLTPFGGAQEAQAAPQELIGLFTLAPGVCSGGTVTTGSYFEMFDGNGAAFGSSECGTDFPPIRDPLEPGTDGGLKTGQYQPAPDPCFAEGTGFGLASMIHKPRLFFGINYGSYTQADVNPRGGTDNAPAPSITHDGAGNLSGDLSAFGVCWSTNFFAQGSPRPDGLPANFPAFNPNDPATGTQNQPNACPPPNLPNFFSDFFPNHKLSQPVSGAYNPSTGAYTLDWWSYIGGSFGCMFTGHWHFEGTFVPGESVAKAAGAGETVTTDTEADGASATDPIETAITTPNAGSVEIREGPLSQPAPGGFAFLGQQVDITAPAATADNPLTIKFRIDPSLIPAGENQNTIQIFKNGVQVGACPGAVSASPDPCVSNRALLGDGDVEITVLTSSASAWNLGVVQATPSPTPTPTVAPAIETPTPTPIFITKTVFGGSLKGTFKIDAGVCDASGKVSTGSSFAMTAPDGKPNKNTSADPGCDPGNDPLAPGADGGLITGVYQPHASPAFDAAGNGLSGRIFQPRKFFATKYGAATAADVVSGNAGQTSAPLPSITLNDTGGPEGTLSGDLSAISIGWSNNFFSQGNPRIDDPDDKDGQGNPRHCANDQPKLRGTFNVETRFFTLDWDSRIGGSFGCGFIGHWHFEGTYEGPIPSRTVSVLAAPGTGAAGPTSSGLDVQAWLAIASGLASVGLLGLIGSGLARLSRRRP